MAPAAVPISTTSELTAAAVKQNLESVEKSKKPHLDASKLTYNFTKSPKTVPALHDPIRLEQSSTSDVSSILETL